MSGDLPVTKLLRVWLACEVLFGLAAILALVPSPNTTATSFAWSIRPTVMASFLGGLYIAIAVVGVLALIARRWCMIRVIVLPALLFTTVELAATILHWHKFLIGTVHFDIWLASYVPPPAIYLVAYIWHEHHNWGTISANPLPLQLRAALLAIGGFIAIYAAVGFAHPAWLSGSFPWALTPLTARVFYGWLILLGTLLVSIGRENDRDRVRLASPFLILLLPALVAQVTRYGNQVNTSRPTLWIGLSVLIFVGGCGVYLSLGSWRASLR